MMSQPLLSETALAPDSPFSFHGMFQGVSAIVLILLVIMIIRWLLRKEGLARHCGARQLQLVGSLTLGQQQKIVLVALPDCQLVLGVTSRQITHLYTLPAAGPATETGDASAEQTSFLRQLRKQLRDRGVRK